MSVFEFTFRYEDEIARLKRGEEIAEDHRPLLPSSNAGRVALAGLQLGEKRSLSVEESQRNVRMRDGGPQQSVSNGAIGEIASAAMASTGSLADSTGISTTASSTTTTTTNTTTTAAAASAYDWLVTYNSKTPRLLSIDLLHSLNFSGVVCCVRFSASGQFLAASGNKLCVIYDAKSGQKLLSLPHDSADGGDLYVRSLSFNSSDTLFASGSEDKLIRVWDISELRTNPQAVPPKQTLQGHTQDVYALEFVDEDWIVSGSGDHSLRLWNVTSGECRCTVESKNSDSVDSGITSLAVASDRKRVVTGSLDRLVRVYDLSLKTATLKLATTLEGHADSVYSVAFDESDGSVLSGSLDKTIRKWSEIDKDKKCTVIANHRDFVLSVVSSSDPSSSSPSSSSANSRSFIISGSKDRTVQFWDETSQSHQLTLQGHKNSVISVAISSLGGIFATGSGDGRARIWSFTNKAE